MGSTIQKDIIQSSTGNLVIKDATDKANPVIEYIVTGTPYIFVHPRNKTHIIISDKSDPQNEYKGFELKTAEVGRFGTAAENTPFKGTTNDLLEWLANLDFRCCVDKGGKSYSPPKGK